MSVEAVMLATESLRPGPAAGGRRLHHNGFIYQVTIVDYVLALEVTLRISV